MRIVIIGAVAGGMSAASKLRRLDSKSDIVVFEKGEDVSYGACGLPYYLSGEVESDQTLVARTPEKFREKGIDLRLRHEATEVNPKKKTVSVHDHEKNETKEEPYDKLLIATGASAIRLPIEGRELGNIHTLSSLEDGRTLHAALRRDDVKHVTLIGAGYIGVEVSEALRALNLEVTMVEQTPHVLPNFTAMVGETVEKTLRENGVDLRLSETVKAYQGDKNVKTVITDKGRIETDLVIEAIGVRPNTAFLESSGIERLGNGAILVNAKMETNLPDIYAAGDVAAMPNRLTGQASYLPLGTHANKAGRIVAERLAGMDSLFEGVIGSTVLKAFDLEVARTGLTAGEAEKSERFEVKTTTVKAPDRSGYYPGATPIEIKLFHDQKTCRLLGCEMVGKSGVAHRINIMATAISTGLTARAFSQLDLAYAPPFSPVWDPLQTACNQIKCG
ncbi:MAG: CoA-disulfide reductase [Bacillota bacterium]